MYFVHKHSFLAIYVTVNDRESEIFRWNGEFSWYHIQVIHHGFYNLHLATPHPKKKKKPVRCCDALAGQTQQQRHDYSRKMKKKETLPSLWIFSWLIQGGRIWLQCQCQSQHKSRLQLVRYSDPCPTPLVPSWATMLGCTFWASWS